ncbi:MAG: sulfate permease [Armatimonadetes bacterium]|nr:sulfate permease [Armatimonadota bacterium]
MLFQKNKIKFNFIELAGSLADLGTLIPIAIALIAFNGLKASSIFLGIGLFYIISGFFYGIPIPIQPFKALCALAIAQSIPANLINLAGFLIGLILILIYFFKIENLLKLVFTRPIIKGIQLGIGLILIKLALNFIFKKELFINSSFTPSFNFFSLNTVLGALGIILILVLEKNKKFPAALILIFLGILVGIIFKGEIVFKQNFNNFSNSSFNLFSFLFLIFSQIPLTLGNSLLATEDLAKKYFGERAHKVNLKNLSLTIGLGNIFSALLGGMPFCHGAGGLAAHYRFGARTAGANIIIGSIFLILGLIFKNSIVFYLSFIPYFVLGVLLLFSGLEMALQIKHLKNKISLLIASVVGILTLIANNLVLGVSSGIILFYALNYLIKKNFKINLESE